MSAPTALPAADAPLAYRLLSGPDDHSFCARVSAALADGYVLYGSPALAFDGGRTVAAQAVILPAALSIHAGATNDGGQ
ncbi:DUF1737 domain-containing protein [Arthrobacter sp. H14-L1]|uniref:DUF1737 domain-containing protein n=1 Tax=Arthrobacter sp. H14-L1 TaxID=2996697 RepID=UPI0022708ADC|nr:DUF1737 domain-containing protein [Arthrobacter sp. H14-L1]MCY0906503.1 DUF1737 domain-containing protein [Arthrobacter sp. H14-L1]